MRFSRKQCKHSPTGKHQFTYHTFTHVEDGQRHKTKVIYCDWCGHTPSGSRFIHGK